MSDGASQQNPRRPAAGAGRPRKLIAAFAAGLTAVALAACGNADVKETSGTYSGVGGLGAPYLSVGALVYNVQISRSLNPYDTEDSAYLVGLPAAQKELHPGEEWFGVFMQVINKTGKSHQVADASDITVSDTEGNVYHPVEIGHTNLYAYRSGTSVPAENQLPTPSSAAASAPINGLLLLYRLKLTSLENRPWTIKIVSPSNPSEKATAELDS
jgi:hypothetical protein